MQTISSDKIVRNETVQVIKDFHLQSLTSQAKKEEQWCLLSKTLSIQAVVI